MVITKQIRQIVNQELAIRPQQSFSGMDYKEARDYFVGRAMSFALITLSVSVNYPDHYKSPSDMVKQAISVTETDILQMIREWNI